MRRPPEPVDLLAAGDPASAFWAAHRDGRRIALRTSGTTNHARTVVRTTQSWVSAFDTVAGLAGMDASASVWIPGPLTATMNLFAVVQAEAVGARVVPDASGASHAVLTPLALARALNSGVLGRGVTVVVAGDVMSAGLREHGIQDGLVLHHYYGASELSFVAWDAHGTDLAVFPGVECRIDNGEIWVRSPYLSDGYLDDDGTGPLRWSPDGYATVGDVGEWRGGALVVHGRGDGGITTAGVTVVVADVEAVLLRADRGTCVVVGVPDERLGAAVCAVVTDPQDVAPLWEAARAGLNSTHRPRRWYVVPEIPMTPGGKPDRVRLATMLDRGEADQVIHRSSGTMRA